MGKRGRRRRDEAQEITRPEQGETYRQYSQQQQTRAPPIGSERVKMMKLEARLNAASSLQAALSPPPGFAPSDTSSPNPRYQTRNYLKAVLSQCKFMTATSRSAVRHVKASYSSIATCDFPAHPITGISHATNEKVDDSVHAELNHHSILSNHGTLDVENQQPGQHTEKAPFPEVVVENNATQSKADVVLDANAELNHHSILSNHGTLDVENQQPGQHTETAPFPEVVAENNAKQSKGDMVLNANATEPESRSNQSGAHPTKTMSLNLTRMAALMNDYSSDADEVGSQPAHLSVVVNGYRVKEEAAPVLQKIFLKYGDIAKNSSFSSVNISSSLLELFCDIYKKLEETDFRSINPKELQSMLDEVRDLESANIDVGWLSRRLNDISQAKQLVKDSRKLKEAKTRNLAVMETSKKELEEMKEEWAACVATCHVLQERIRKKEDEFGIARCENEMIMQQFEDSKAKVNDFLKKSLVHDLL
ncbi:uncharacterized protein LOC107763994 [Nicotiana tabacum]|uniref:Uncharacterized protein LOC107763994 n=1 Tax=Nicotiana tabacum TaxID=4097 RepID=A0A1S3XDY3_TOBAC|nr:PREDICTED: uncharacterized protein LOC107763994 [Nicotiana tabacum]